MYGVHYYQIIKKSKDSFFLREQLVKYALGNSIKAAAREFKTTPKTVRNRVRRFNENKKTGLRELSLNYPNKRLKWIPLAFPFRFWSGRVICLTDNF